MVVWERFLKICGCVAALLAPAAASSFLATAATAQMRFSTASFGDEASCGRDCPRIILADGDITRSAGRDFAAFVAREAGSPGLRNIVFISSPGGDVFGSIELGAAFRVLGSTVVVARVNRGGGIFRPNPVDARTGNSIPTGAITNATCNSACVYALMGGKRRIVPAASRVGVHRIQVEQRMGFDPVSGRVVEKISNWSAGEVNELKRYARFMGVDARLIDIAEAVPHEDIRYLQEKEVKRFRLAVQTFR